MKNKSIQENLDDDDDKQEGFIGGLK